MSSTEPSPTPPASNKLSPLEIGIIAAIVVLVIAIGVVLITRTTASSTTTTTPAATALPGDPVERAFAVCVNTMQTQLLADNQQQLDKADPATREQLTAMFKQMAESGTCNIVKTSCAKNRNDAICVGLLKKYQ